MNRKTVLGIIAAIALFGGAAMMASRYSDAETAPAPATPSGSATAAASTTPATTSLSKADVEKLMKPRVLGKADAPVRLTEYASLTCPHCAHFYRDVFPQLKANYIDTGKVAYVYMDYPLNAPALDAAATALCVPEESYFKFIDYLFMNVEDWASKPSPGDAVLQNAKLLGGDADRLQTCSKSVLLKGAIIERMKKANTDFQIDSTPSFIINDKDVIRGSLDYEAMKAKIDAYLATGSKSK